jgi:hypothetical protein
MILLVSGATWDVNFYTSRFPEFYQALGSLIVPRAGNTKSAVTIPQRWAGDNGAFSHFDERLFLKMLHQFRQTPGCLFIAAPDKVGDATATLTLFRQWEPIIKSYGYPVALVSQDGLTHRATPWTLLDAMFIGGSTEWKLGRQAASLAGYAKAMGKWVHMGRVNSKRRMAYAYSIGCDSVDGSKFSKFPGTWIPRAMTWIRSIEKTRV